MLVSVKLLFSMFDHESVDQRTTVRDDQRTSSIVPDVPGTVQQAGRGDQAPSGTVPADRTNTLAPSRTGPTDPMSGQLGTLDDAASVRSGDPDRRAALLDTRTVAHLIPAAREAHATLVSVGRSLSRDNLADALREDGQGVSNARASLLLKILRAEQEAATIGSASIQPRQEGPYLQSQVEA